MKKLFLDIVAFLLSLFVTISLSVAMLTVTYYAIYGAKIVWDGAKTSLPGHGVRRVLSALGNDYDSTGDEKVGMLKHIYGQGDTLKQEKVLSLISDFKADYFGQRHVKSEPAKVMQLMAEDKNGFLKERFSKDHDLQDEMIAYRAQRDREAAGNPQWPSSLRWPDSGLGGVIWKIFLVLLPLAMCVFISPKIFRFVHKRYG